MYPAGIAGISARFVRLADGLRLRVLEAGPRGGRTVLLVHGWGASIYTYCETVPALAAAGYRVVAFDLPGHGLSDKPADTVEYSTSAMNDRVVAVAEALDIGKFAFVGHSMGGALGLDLARRHAARMSHLVLINAVGLGRAPLIALLRIVSPSFVNPILPPLLSRTVIAATLRAAFGTDDRPSVLDIDEYWAPTQFPEFAWACRALVHRLRWGATPPAELRALRMPVLVITGQRDRLVHGGSSRARLIPGVRSLVIPDGGHLVLQECADRTNAALVAFFRE